MNTSCTLLYIPNIYEICLNFCWIPCKPDTWDNVKMLILVGFWFPVVYIAAKDSHGIMIWFGSQGNSHLLKVWFISKLQNQGRVNGLLKPGSRLISSTWWPATNDLPPMTCHWWHATRWPATDDMPLDDLALIRWPDDLPVMTCHQIHYLQDWYS